MKTQENSELHQFFIQQLMDVYNAEQQLIEALPTMAEAATSTELRRAFENHLAETNMHARRLEKAFEFMDEPLSSQKCQAMKGLIAEGEEVIDDTEEDTLVRDCALIVAAQKVEHYEIASYGSLRTLAEILGYLEVATLLQTTLDEEYAADDKLTSIATGYINQGAEEEG